MNSDQRKRLKNPENILNGYQSYYLGDGYETTFKYHYLTSSSTTATITLSSTFSATHIYLPNSTTTSLETPTQRRKKKLKNARHFRLTFALFVLFTFLLLSIIPQGLIDIGNVISILTGLYKTGNIFMSTWVPLLWAAISVMVGY
ncbi:hypothetical protein BDP27DRAFT_1312084 [Rhodocollybia butyracea]|uniref:Uncharacterized protein n=1 Tax=Rhodocollybia butyracea TaxID=206335 RepID=A0A9P5UFG6_9AGAR|nr:hypothetical protein BDP27DRAFT_1312084 [Rhodocollybia butyracea]